MSDTDYVSGREAARLLGIPRSTFWRELELRRVPGARQDKAGQWSIPRATIDKLLAGRTAEQVARERAAIVASDLGEYARALWAARYREWAEDLRAAAQLVAKERDAKAWGAAVEQLVALMERRREWQAVRTLQLALEQESAQLAREANVALEPA